MTRFYILLLVSSTLVLGCVPQTHEPESDKLEANKKESGKNNRAPDNDATNLNKLTAEEIADGWLLLFDGESLFGWRDECQGDWRVADGTIVVTQGEVGLLRTTTQFDNYVLKVDFRSAEGTNSGIFLRTSPSPQDPTDDCYELNIADSDNPFPTCSLVGRQKVEGNFDSGGWQSCEITMSGPQVTVKLDGNLVLDYTDLKPLGRGFIGLQHNSGRVEFRNIKLRPLGLESIFNGKDLSGWKTYPEMESKFAVTQDGHLNVKNGRGQLETEGTYGDFILQLECMTRAEQLNSGIFFRCIPGDVMMGYESQIHNGFEEGDRTKPVDCGTGGIFHRVDARRVVSDDLTWFSKTIIVEGPHVSVWVNGIQVTDWTDTRKRHDNPRKGLRLEPGTIMIQGHDPTTDISFRKLFIREMAKRRP